MLSLHRTPLALQWHKLRSVFWSRPRNSAYSYHMKYGNVLLIDWSKCDLGIETFWACLYMVETIVTLFWGRHFEVLPSVCILGQYFRTNWKVLAVNQVQKKCTWLLQAFWVVTLCLHPRSIFKTNWKVLAVKQV